MTWATVALGDVTTIVSGATPRTGEKQFWDGEILWTTPKDLSDLDGPYLDRTPRTITGEGLKSCSASVLPVNSVLLSSRAPIGLVAINSVPMATNQGFKSFVPNERKLDSKFLFHWLKSKTVFLQSLGNGATFKEVSKSVVERVEIPLPPLAEQQRIAAILDKADALRRRRKRALELLDGLTQSIFLEMFGDPVRNPKAWDKIKLGDLCDVGSSKRVFAREFVEDGIPFYRGTEIGKLGAGEYIVPDLFISPDHYDRLIRESGKPEIGDLLLPSICEDGRIWRVNDGAPFFFKDGRVLWIKSHAAQINSEYLRSLLRSIFRNSYQSIASGTTFAELKIVNLKNLQVLYPPLQLQSDFSFLISKVQKLQLELGHSETVARALFSSLQRRAFSGQL